MEVYNKMMAANPLKLLIAQKNCSRNCGKPASSRIGFKKVEQVNYSFFLRLMIRLPHQMHICCVFGINGFSRLVERGFQEYSLASLNMKKPMSPTPLKCVRRALILALNDSAEALVNLPSK